jgi:trk system potassium uptake protein TrkH
MSIIKNANVYSKILLTIGALNFVPLFVLFFYPGEDLFRYVLSFTLPGTLLCLSGFLCARLFPQKAETIGEYETSLQKGSLPVLFAWGVGILSGALPFIIYGISVTESVFESTSGWTTTGITIFEDIESFPHIFLFHRAFLQYCGGLGLIFMLLLFAQGKQASLLFSAEGHNEKFTPSLKQTAHTIFAVYNIFLALGIFLYVIFGMDLFDAVCHTMSAISTAGFSNKTEGLAFFDNPGVEYVTVLLMLLGSTSFSVITFLGRLQFKKVIQDIEVKFMLFLVVIPFILWGFSRKNLLNIVSLFSTTGFADGNLYQAPAFEFVTIILLMLIGGSVGSTSGGIKILRVYLLFRITKESIRRKVVSPSRVLPRNYSKVSGFRKIDENTVYDTIGFIVTFFAIIVIGTIILILTENCTAKAAFFEFVSAFTNTGISSGLTNINANFGTLITIMVAMILGRLEMFIVFIGFYTLIVRKSQAK